MKIRDLEIKNNIFTAPMAGVTDLAYRGILKRMGAGLMFTEMVSAKALCYHDKKTAELMELTEAEAPVGVQIFGSDPQIMAQGAKIIEETTNASCIDINMGCPVPKVAGNGEGSALLKTPSLAGQIVEAVASAVRLPVTVKMRIGWDEARINAVEFARILAQSGACAITVHGRTREQYYSGKADWEQIRAVKEAVAVPVVGNGDIFLAQDAENMLRLTGCDAVMLGRGIMGNPWLVRECVCLFQSGLATPPPSFDERLQMALIHTRELVRTKGEYRGIREARAHLTWYAKGQRGAAKVKERLTRACSVEEVAEILAAWREEHELYYQTH